MASCVVLGIGWQVEVSQSQYHIPVWVGFGIAPYGTSLVLPVLAMQGKDKIIVK
jgi:hypothetical protein